MDITINHKVWHLPIKGGSLNDYPEIKPTELPSAIFAVLNVPSQDIRTVDSHWLKLKFMSTRITPSRIVNESSSHFNLRSIYCAWTDSPISVVKSSSFVETVRPEQIFY